MATYGLKTVKADNTTVVLQNSNKSGVFGRAYTLSNTDSVPSDGIFFQRMKLFPEYKGRTIIAFQLNPAPGVWNLAYTVDGTPLVEFDIGISPTDKGVPNAQFNYTSGSTLYIFVK